MIAHVYNERFSLERRYAEHDVGEHVNKAIHQSTGYHIPSTVVLDPEEHDYWLDDIFTTVASAGFIGGIKL